MADQNEEPTVVRARESAQFEHEGTTVRIIKGKTTVAVGHPILKGRLHLFEPLAVDFPLPQQSSSRSKASA